MPVRLTWVTFPPPNSPMGLQAYESSVLAAMQAASSPERYDHRLVAGLRAPGSGVTRIPTRLLLADSPSLARAVGRWAYRGCEAVHRFDLRLPPPRVPEVVTVHDLPGLRFDDEGRLARWSVVTAKNARLVLCPSSFAADEVTELLGVERVVVIPNGVAQTYREARPLTDAELGALGVRGPLVLHAGGATKRKNLAALASAWPDVLDRVPDATLVLAGPPDGRRDVLFRGVRHVASLGYRSPSYVARLMASATCVVVPSVYEGFGLPALEGMAAGSVVVAAARGALPEVCGDAALLCEPTAPGLGAAITDVLRDEHLRDDLRARGSRRAAEFTWARSAAAHLEAYRLAFP